MSEHTMKIELEGLIHIFAQNLYTNPDVFVRELIQNAHDSIHRRRALAEERKEPPPPTGEIRILPRSTERLVTFWDNGCGLTEDEVHKYLATIGRSGTGELRRALQSGDRKEAFNLIGQFGIGLLSAFIVAREVEVITRAPNSPACRWFCSGGQRYTVDDGERDAVGTTVNLRLGEQYHRFLQIKTLEETVRLYADFIGIPVYIGDQADPANAMHAPWHREYKDDTARLDACHLFWERRFLTETSLAVLPVDEEVCYLDPEDPAKQRHSRVQGVLGITDRHVPGLDTRGTVDVYISRMYVASGSRDVLPPWARFIQGVIDCRALTPNAARDSVVRNGALKAVQNTLGDLIIRYLTRMSQENPERFVQIMRWHSFDVLAMCVQEENEDFFRAVADLVPLDTDQGPMTVQDYLAKAPKRSDGRRAVCCFPQ